MKKTSLLFFIFFFAAVIFMAAGGGPVFAGNLGMLTLDQLLDVDVVTVAKVPEKVRNTPAAIQVITQEDLRRSGVNSIPEALRLVPGMHVYRIDANKWAISSRGFTSQFANKMLVMIDGRIVYAPLFSGVFWDVQDLMLADVDRIEVIRGPGGSLWGANAVNGIINIISKDSADSQGGLVSLEGGRRDRNAAAVRYGGWLDERTSYRFYGKYFDRHDLRPAGFWKNHDIADIDDANDDYHAGRTGFRLDRNQGRGDKLTLQGDVYRGTSGNTVIHPSMAPPHMYPDANDADVSGGNLLGRWSHVFSPAADMTLQVYYDRTRREGDFLRETRDTVDFDLQHRQALGRHHELLVGVGYRYSRDDIDTDSPPHSFYFLRFDPDSRGNDLFTGFIQDRFRFAGGHGELTVGTKIEHNEYTGTEWQPSVRCLWKFNDRNTVWGAVSRAVRTPSRLEHDGSLNIRPREMPISPSLSVTMVPRMITNGDLDSEKVMAYELGYKTRPSDDLYLDVAAFYNRYHDLAAGFKPGTPFLADDDAMPYMVVPLLLGNNFDAETFGVELNGNWSVTPSWRLTAGFSWFECNILHENGYSDVRPEFREDNESRCQLSLVSYLDLPGRLELNGMLFYVDQLEELEVDSYTRLDLNLAWHATDNLTLTVGGRNLLDPWHPEYDSITAGIFSSEIPRTFYGKLCWSF
ncbi:MAG: TonB-dependent receptor [Deltaproteobacteria bacterium]|nr:TonB-dependent receptor [Deltaproteobacteria bacterium]